MGAVTWPATPTTTTWVGNQDQPCGGRRTRATRPAAAPGPGRVTASPARAAAEAAAARAASAGAGVVRVARAVATAITMMIAPRATTTTAVTMATTTDGGISHLILTPFEVPWHRPSVPLSPLSARLDVSSSSVVSLLCRAQGKTRL